MNSRANLVVLAKLVLCLTSVITVGGCGPQSSSPETSMFASNLQRYYDKYSRLKACSIPTAVRMRLVRTLNAREFDELGQEMFVDLDVSKAASALGVDAESISSGYFYVFSYCGRPSLGTSFIKAWVPFRVYNAVNPGNLTLEAANDGSSIIKASSRVTSETSYILLYDGFGVLLSGERSAVEVGALSVAFFELAGVN